jgi:hypothetical protein
MVQDGVLFEHLCHLQTLRCLMPLSLCGLWWLAALCELIPQQQQQQQQ